MTGTEGQDENEMHNSPKSVKAPHEVDDLEDSIFYMAICYNSFSNFHMLMLSKILKNGWVEPSLQLLYPGVTVFSKHSAQPFGKWID